MKQAAHGRKVVSLKKMCRGPLLSACILITEESLNKNLKNCFFFRLYKSVKSCRKVVALKKCIWASVHVILIKEESLKKTLKLSCFVLFFQVVQERQEL
jgi:hypothetical protein